MISKFSSISILHGTKPLSNIWSKGCGLFGALGLENDFNDADCFERISSRSQEGPTLTTKKVSAGWGHSAAITTEGRLLIFGRPYDFTNIMRLNRFRMVSPGLGRLAGKFSEQFGDNTGIFHSPIELESDNRIVDVQCSAALTMALTSEGEVYSMGHNRWGQCGIGSEKIAHVYALARVQLNDPVVAVDTGLQHCAAVTEKGTVFTWGKGNRGQLGRENKEHTFAPIALEDIPVVVSVSAGFTHTAALASDGSVFVWGKGMSDVQAKSRGSVRVFEDQIEPRKVQLPGKRNAVEISSSNFVLVIRADDDTLWAMGIGEYDRCATCYPLPVLQPLYLTHTAYSPPFAASGSAVQSEAAIEAGEEGLVTNPAAQQTAHIPASAILCKGNHRVAVLFSHGTDPFSSKTASSSKLNFNSRAEGPVITTKAFEVVLHAQQAFLQPVEFCVPPSSVTPNESIDAGEDPLRGDATVPSPTLRVTDYSVGWQHSLMILDTSSP